MHTYAAKATAADISAALVAQASAYDTVLDLI